MDIRVEYTKQESRESAYEAVKGAVTPELLAKFQVKAEIDYQEDQIVAAGKGFKLVMEFLDDACEVSLNLSFLLKPLKGKVIEGVKKQMVRIL